MRITRTTSVIVVLLLVTSLLPAAMAQTNTLGIGPNDVRDEPNHPLDDNGFPNTDFSPQSPSLILESYVQHGIYFAHDDTNNIINRAQHGNSYDAWESYLVPGFNVFEAYWGWWTDTGSGGDLQDYDLGGGPNGAIDDTNDAETVDWDEFVWRGANEYASLHGQCLDDETTDDGDDVYSYDECAEDEMLVFVQPGTHNIHVNCIPVVDSVGGCALSNESDEAGEPDFIMEWNQEDWREENGFARAHYDQSLLMATTVTTSVDPVEVGDGNYDPLDAEAVDVDGYSAIHQELESLYRTAVYDPGDEVDGTLLFEEGVKQYAKEDPEEDVLETVNGVYRPAVGPFFEAVNPTRGLADDQVFPNFPHEPNTADDQYDFASFDSSTSYGGEPYYDPGPGQDYSTYATEEHFWGDSYANHDGSTNAVVFRTYGGDNLGIPTGDAMGSKTMTPGSSLYLEANVGTWFDDNGDTWIGNASDERDISLGGVDTTEQDAEDPYASGLIDDPNDYGSDEFRGTCSADLKWTVEPMTPDQRWGDTGVYVYESTFNPYVPMLEDATGGTTATDPVQEQASEGSVVYDAVLNEDDDDVQGGGQLSRYVTEGPIEITGFCSSVQFGSGAWDPNRAILFPAGNMDYTVKVTFEATLTDTERTAIDDADNGGNSLTGETIVDVDYLAPSV